MTDRSKETVTVTTNTGRLLRFMVNRNRAGSADLSGNSDFCV